MCPIGVDQYAPPRTWVCMCMGMQHFPAISMGLWVSGFRRAGPASWRVDGGGTVEVVRRVFRARREDFWGLTGVGMEGL